MHRSHDTTARSDGDVLRRHQPQPTDTLLRGDETNRRRLNRKRLRCVPAQPDDAGARVAGGIVRLLFDRGTDMCPGRRAVCHPAITLTIRSSACGGVAGSFVQTPCHVFITTTPARNHSNRGYGRPLLFEDLTRESGRSWGV